MAPTSTTLTTKVQEGTPYQLDENQVTRAATALVQHIQKQKQESEAKSVKKSLLADVDGGSDEEAGNSEDVPIWLVVTTKKHILDKKRLKPGKIAIPNTLYADPNARICLITADPQRTYKDIVAQPTFPSDLAGRIGRVIGLQKLKAKYKSYESRRQLLGEYDIFLADERIITYLPATLGKIFFKSTTKRPIPVSLTGSAKPVKDTDGKKQKKKPESAGDKGSALAGTPEEVGAVIHKTFKTAPVHLSPSATTSIRVAYSSFTPAQIAENLTAVVNALAERFITQGWRNIRSIHIKGPNTAALPVWLASELWVDEKDVHDEKFVEAPREKKDKGKKRQAAEAVEAPEEEAKKLEAPSTKKTKKGELDDGLAKEIALRKEKLKKQKEAALVGAERPAKKSKRAVAVA